MNKKYKFGFVLGRFQCLHSGHEEIIDALIENCERCVVLVGSAQEMLTEKNPYNYEFRETCLKVVYGNAIEIYPLNDADIGDNAAWGDYVMNSIKELCGEYPDFTISGTERCRANWYSNFPELTEMQLDKSLPISGTKMREYLYHGDYVNWQRYTNEKLLKTYPIQKMIILHIRHMEDIK